MTRTFQQALPVRFRGAAETARRSHVRSTDSHDHRRRRQAVPRDCPLRPNIRRPGGVEQMAVVRLEPADGTSPSRRPVQGR